MIRPLQEVDGAGVYLLYNTGRLVYVGQTSNFARRRLAFRADVADSAALLPVPDRTRRLKVEAFLIAALDPPGNTVSAPTPGTIHVSAGGKQVRIGKRWARRLAEISEVTGLSRRIVMDKLIEHYGPAVKRMLSTPVQVKTKTARGER